MINAGTGNDDVDAGAGDDIIDAGTGNNTVMGGTGADTFVINAGESRLAFLNSFTIIEDFVSGTDLLDVDGNGGYAEADGSLVAPGDFAALIALADATMDAGQEDVFVVYDAFNSGDAFVFVDDNGDGSYQNTETFFQLVGIDTAGEIGGGDFI